MQTAKKTTNQTLPLTEEDRDAGHDIARQWAQVKGIKGRRGVWATYTREAMLNYFALMQTLGIQASAKDESINREAV